MNAYENFALDLNNKIHGMTFCLNEPMKNHTSFRIGGPADVFIEARIDNISDIISLCKLNDIPVTIVGNGSNILVGDKGIRGVVLSLGKEISDVTFNGNVVTVQAGKLLSILAKEAYENSLSGLEFASGIPGSVGGAIYMNAGAYDGSMKDCTEKVTCLSMDSDKIISYTKEELKFDYRYSRFQEEKGIILEVEIKLQAGNKTVIKNRMDELTILRKEKQPIEYPSAGSTFKRPPDNFAGKLIMDAGLMGHRIGDATVSQKHAGFIINKGDATATDVVRLIDDVKSIVLNKTGVELEPEVKFIGDF